MKENTSQDVLSPPTQYLITKVGVIYKQTVMRSQDRLAECDSEFDGGAHLSVDVYINKLGDEDYFVAIVLQITLR